MEHDHRDGLSVPPADPTGWNFDADAISQAVGAFGRCGACFDYAVDTIAADPHTTARIVLAAAAVVADAFGAIPPELADPNGRNDQIWMGTVEFRTLLAAFFDPDPAATAEAARTRCDQIPPAAAAMTAAQRRNAVTDAIGYLTIEDEDDTAPTGALIRQAFTAGVEPAMRRNRRQRRVFTSAPPAAAVLMHIESGRPAPDDPHAWDRMPEHLRPNNSGRGFYSMPPIGAVSGGVVILSESSVADAPQLSLSLAIDGAPDLATVRITVDAAQQLAEQLKFLAVAHYQTPAEDL